MYYLVDLHDDKMNFIDGINSDTCYQILDSSTIVSETLEFYYLGKCVGDSLDALLQWSSIANPNGNYIMRNLHSSERLVRGFLFEWRTCLDHMETEIKHKYGKKSELLKVFEESTHAAYDAYPEYAFTCHLRNVCQHCQNIVHGFNSSTGIGISSNVQKLLDEYDKWKPVDRNYMNSSGENIDLIKTLSVAFRAFNEALAPVLRYLLNTKDVGKKLLHLRAWGDFLQKQFHHDIHCYHIFDLKFENGREATREDLAAGNVIINANPIDWDMVYELSNSVSVIDTSTVNDNANNFPLP